MIRYAVSLGCFTKYVTPQLAAALRAGKFRNVEVNFGPYAEPESLESAASKKLTAELMAEKTIIPASVHLPFYGGGLSWDPSNIDEAERKNVSARFQKIIRDNASLMAPLVTLHASNEPPMAEHPQRLLQARKTISELLPLAKELNFCIDIEFLPRCCIGNCVEELEQLVEGFDPKYVGICFDVNHIMNRYAELPQMITRLASRIRSFHISDYDGIDETHWFPGQGIIDWPSVMAAIRAIDHDVLLILETSYQLGGHLRDRDLDPRFALRENETAVWYMENCERINRENQAFQLPGQC